MFLRQSCTELGTNRIPLVFEGGDSGWMCNEELTLRAHRTGFRFGGVGSEVPGEQLSLNPEDVPPRPAPLTLLFPVVVTLSPERSLQLSGGWGAPRQQHHILEDTGFRLGGSGCDHSRGRLPDRKAGGQACRWAHTGASCAAAGAQASCSNPSGSDQQDGPAQAEGSLQGGTLLQTEAGAPGGGRQEELPGLLSWHSSSGFRAGSDRRPFSHLPPPPPRASLAHGIIITLVDG